jgi:hypothetical protein
MKAPEILYGVDFRNVCKVVKEMFREVVKHRLWGPPWKAFRCKFQSSK